MKKVLLSLLIASPLSMLAQCTELFISEYCEGSGNNKAIEIYNPTANSINLTGYVLERYSNGNATVQDQLVLSGTVAAHDVFVIVNGQTTSTTNSPACDPALQAMADQLDGVYPAPTYMNGDDALGLSHNGVLVDIFGKIGEDPGTAWTDVFPYTDAGGGTWLTNNHTLVRHANVTQGVTVNPLAFNTFLEYDTMPVNTWTGLGIHACACGTAGIAVFNQPTVAIYPNPVAANQPVTVSSSSAITTVEFFTLDGKLVKSVSNTSQAKTLTISTSDLQKNTYLLVTNTSGKQPFSTKIKVQ
jgi:hypothetical protein